MSNVLRSTVTNDGRTHKFNIASVSAGTIDGQHESIPIDQVASLQKRELDVGNTALVVGLPAVDVVLFVALAAGLRGAADTAILNSSH